MDVVNKQVARIQQQLAGLTASQKMLTGALVVIMVMTLLYWGRYAGTAELEPLLNQSLSPTELGQIQDRLQAKGIKFKADGDRLLVPPDRQREILADLAFSKLLPRNMESGFDQMVAKLSPWASASERHAVYNRAKEMTCSQIIGLFPGVEHAQVMIDPTRTRHIGANIEPSATITIGMRDDDGRAAARKVAEGAAAVVAGAQAGLAPERINVVINGQPQRVRAPGQGGLAYGDEQLELRAQHQQRYIDSIMATLSYIPDVRVSVAVDLNMTETETEEQQVDPAKSFSKPRSTETEESETIDRGDAAEPGAVPNLGDRGTANGSLEIPGAGGTAGGAGGTSTTTSKEKTQFDNIPGYTKKRTKTGTGGATITSASVGVPRSYFVGVLRQKDPAKTPSHAEVDLFAAEKMKVMERAVRASAGMAEDAPVEVAQFDDLIPLVPAGVPQTATASIPLLIGSHSKEIALGGLALVSLFMVSMMVRKSSPAPALVGAGAMGGGSGLMGGAGGGGGAGPGATLLAGEALAGEARDGNPLLNAVELDEDAARTQQMLDQVSTLVKDNPDAAASLVKRWMNRD